MICTYRKPTDRTKMCREEGAGRGWSGGLSPNLASKVNHTSPISRGRLFVTRGVAAQR